MEADQKLIDDADTVFKSIMSGEYDADISRLAYAIGERKRLVSWQAGRSLSPGDRVKITSGRPKYLQGATGTVRKVMQSYIILDLDQRVDRFHLNIRTPMSIIEKIPANIPAK